LSVAKSRKAFNFPASRVVYRPPWALEKLADETDKEARRAAILNLTLQRKPPKAINSRQPNKVFSAKMSPNKKELNRERRLLTIAPDRTKLV
jgi:hypothetical protein